MKKSIELRRCEILDTKLERFRLKTNDLSKIPVKPITGAPKLGVLSGKQEKDGNMYKTRFIKK